MFLHLIILFSLFSLCCFLSLPVFLRLSCFPVFLLLLLSYYMIASSAPWWLQRLRNRMMVIESHHSFSSLTDSSDRPTSLSVGLNSGSAWVLVSPDPLLCVHIFLSLWFSPTIKYESELAKSKVFNISWSWLSSFSYLTVICCRPLM